MRRSFAAVLCLLGLALSIAAAEDEPCTVTDAANGRVYDLRPLMGDRDYEAKDEAAQKIFKLNVCGPIRTNAENVKDSSRVGVYQQGSDGGLSLGQYNRKPRVSHGVLSLVYEDGSTCPAHPTLSMGSVIAFQCDHSITTGRPEFVAALNDCNFFFVWRTQHACSQFSAGIASGMSTVMLAVIVIMCLYIVGYLAYNRFVLKRNGRDQIPPLGPSLKDALLWIKDIAMIAAVGIYDAASQVSARLKGGRTFQGLPPDSN